MHARRRSLGIFLTLLSAAAFALAFPPTSWRPLAWVALVPFFLAVREGSLRWAAGLTWLWSLAAAYGVGDWFPNAVATYFHQPAPVALALFFAVFTVMAAPYYLAFAWAYRALAGRYAAALPLLAAAAWVTAELGRGRLFTGTAFFIGNPWGLLGYSHADVLPLAQVAALGGIYAVTFAIVCVNAAVAGVAWAALRREPLRPALLGLGIAIAPALLGLGYGRLVLRDAPRLTAEEAITVTVAQGNVAIGSRWRADAYGENLDVYLRLTEAAAERDAPRIAFWPEAAMTFFLEDEPLYRRTIAGLLDRHDLELVTGGPRTRPEEPPAFWNSVFVVDRKGEITDRYDKEYLVPFAEYFPLRIDVLRRRFGRIRTFEAGDSAEPLATRAGAAGVLVCNEAMLPEVARARVEQGAEYLLNPSNDTWISAPKYAEQQLDIALVRAIEQRRWLVRASTSGPSALVDPWGRIKARTSPSERAVVVGEIAPRAGRTPYARYGDAFALGCLGLVAVALVSGRRTR